MSHEKHSLNGSNNENANSSDVAIQSDLAKRIQVLQEENKLLNMKLRHTKKNNEQFTRDRVQLKSRITWLEKELEGKLEISNELRLTKRQLEIANKKCEQLGGCLETQECLHSETKQLRKTFVEQEERVSELEQENIDLFEEKPTKDVKIEVIKKGNQKLKRNSGTTERTCSLETKVQNEKEISDLKSKIQTLEEREQEMKKQIQILHEVVSRKAEKIALLETQWFTKNSTNKRVKFPNPFRKKPTALNKASKKHFGKGEHGDEDGEMLVTENVDQLDRSLQQQDVDVGCSRMICTKTTRRRSWRKKRHKTRQDSEETK